MRFQGDTRWQRDFGRMSDEVAQCIEHTRAGRQLLKEGCREEARAELALAEEANERAELIAHALMEDI